MIFFLICPNDLPNWDSITIGNLVKNVLNLLYTFFYIHISCFCHRLTHRVMHSHTLHILDYCGLSKLLKLLSKQTSCGTPSTALQLFEVIYSKGKW